MNKPSGLSAGRPVGGRDGFIALGCLLALIAIFFHRSFAPGQALFANDGNLGVVVGHSDQLLQMVKGFWQELNFMGIELPSSSPNVDFLLLWTLGPILSAKFTAALSLVAVGMCCWFFFRTLGFPAWVCLLGSVATALNSNIFSNTCWGVFLWTFARGFVFLALAAIYSATQRRFIVKAILAGFATGMAIMEGYDIGAIFSLYVAAFTAFLCWTRGEGSGAQRVLRSIGGVALVAVAAALIAAHALFTLVGTQIKGISGADENTKNTEVAWTFATQWSFPKIETLRIIIPGLFGYRMESQDGTQYWGAVGQQPGWFEHHQGYARHSAEGEYAGILVVLVAAWAAVHVFRKKGNPYTPDERRHLAFWIGAALISLLMAFGRHAPLYQFYYALPFFSTMRNPIKFLEPFNLSVIILFGYGLAGMGRVYLSAALAPTASLTDHLKSWWRGVTGFDRRWVLGTVAFVAVSLLGWLVFAASRTEMLRYLEECFWPMTPPTLTEQTEAVFRHANYELGLYLVFLLLSLGLLVMIQSGWFAGRRLRWAVLLLGALLIVDLGRANLPWIKFYDYQDKYASNPIIDFLKQSPHEYRVELPHLLMKHSPVYIALPKEVAFFPDVCFMWLEHLFQFYRIQSLAINQAPRMPFEYTNYFGAFGAGNTNVPQRPVRLWELTNTRYLLTLAGYLEAINRELDPQLRRFRFVSLFTLTNTPSGNITALTNTFGPFALVEFAGALPRAKLFHHWQVNTNDADVLRQLADPAFDPHQLVLVSTNDPNLPSPSASASTNAGTVEITRYQSKFVQCQARAEVPSVLLLNDKFHPNWSVTVDGKPATLLRCNYIARGVFLSPGNHQVEYRFTAPTQALNITVAFMIIGILLVGFVAWGGRHPPPSQTDAAEPGPKEGSAKPSKKSPAP